jgi:release factor glutamine methyltransferase
MGVKIQTIKDIRFYLAKELAGLYSEPELRTLANILIKTVTGASKLHQMYDNNYPVRSAEAERIIEIVKELETGRPIQFVLGETIFYNCRIKLNGATLIPRPETEELVDLIIRENRGYKGDIVDFGSGSGCISIALSANLPAAHVTGIEISENAIKIARENAGLNNVNVTFIKGDIFNPDWAVPDNTDIIVSNPPYVRDSEKLLMSKNVLDFEPASALFVTDSDPLIYYDAILKLAEDILSACGRVYFEINEAMGSRMFRLVEKFNYSAIEVVKDLNGKDRILKARKNGR